VAAARRDRDARTAPIFGCTRAAREARGLEPVEELDDRVMAERHALGERGDGGLGAYGQAAQREQELVLARLEPDIARGLLGECEELAKPIAEVGECPVVLIAQL